MASKELDFIASKQNAIYDNINTYIVHNLYNVDKISALADIESIKQLNPNVTINPDYKQNTINYYPPNGRIRTNKKAVQIIIDMEDFRSEPYINPLPPHDTYYIGYGTSVTFLPNGGLNLGFGITIPGREINKAMAERIMYEHIRSTEADLNRYILRPVTDNQYSALVSLAYNVGAPRLASYKLMKYLNAGNIPAAAREFDDITNGGNPRLVLRRQLEKGLFLEP